MSDDAAPDFASVPPADGYDTLPVFAEVVKRLAALPEHEYELVRKGEAKNLGMRTTVLDKCVQAARPHDGEASAGQGRPITVEDAEPWPDPVAAAGLLDEISAFVEDHVVLPPHAGTKTVLWITHTHTYEASFITPRLAITSPTMQCGKTTLLDVIGSLVSRPVSASNLTAAVTFRIIALAKPTLLVDEADTFMHYNEELRGVINAGNRKGGTIKRVVGDNHEPREFDVFAPCAIAGIRNLPPSIADRSIHIRMVRKSRAESVRSFRADRTEVSDRLRSMLARFAADNLPRLAAADPDLPAGAFNRFADNWRPLAAIAQLAGGTWPARVRAAILHDLGEDPDEELGQLLLDDIRSIFDQSITDDPLASSGIVAALKNMTERPWNELGRNRREITTNILAGMLKPFGIKSANHRFPPLLPGGTEQVLKGYKRADFAEAWNRYRAPPEVSRAATPLHPCKSSAFDDSEPLQETSCSGSKSRKAETNQRRSGVAARNPSGGNSDGKKGKKAHDELHSAPAEGAGIHRSARLAEAAQHAGPARLRPVVEEQRPLRDEPSRGGGNGAVQHPPLDSGLADDLTRGAGQTVASVPFMIPRATKAKLRERGFSDDQIRHMTPFEAQRVLITGALGRDPS